MVNWLSRAFLKKMDFLPKVTEFFESKNTEEQLSEEVVYQFAGKVSEQLNIELWKTSLIPLIVLVVSNITIGILIKVYL